MSNRDYVLDEVVERGRAAEPETDKDANPTSPNLRKFIVIADPFTTHYQDFATNRKVHTESEAMEVAARMAEKNNAAFYVAKLVYRAAKISVKIEPV